MKTKPKDLKRFVQWKTAVLAAAAVAVLAATPVFAGDNDNDGDDLKFDLVPSKGLPDGALKGALKNAHGRVRIESVGPVEIMNVIVWGLPPNTDFDFFVIQVPNRPFGLSWYQGDIETNRNGEGYGRFVGRFNIESFIVSPASVRCPSRLQERLSGCCAWSGERTCAYLPPWPVVQFSDGWSEGRCTGHYPFQRGRRRGCPGAQYRGIPGSCWSADQAHDKR